MYTEKGPAGRHAHVYGLNEFRELLGIPPEGEPVSVAISWAEGKVEVVMSGESREHEHRFQGQKLKHSHADGDKPHGYYEHPEDAR